ncbi:MAG: hypothetical protein WBX11_17945 [Thiobacillaceae bacterium]
MKSWDCGKIGYPHIHVLLFVGKHEDAAEVVSSARDLRAKAVIKAGLGQINEHGFDVRGGDYAAEYIAKFGKETSRIQEGNPTTIDRN